MKYKGFTNLPVIIVAAFLIGSVSVSVAKSYNVYSAASERVNLTKLGQQLVENELDRIRSLNYDDVNWKKREASNSIDGFDYEIIVGKEYREDIGNTVMKHKPYTLNVYAGDENKALLSVSSEKVSRWYKSGSFDSSNSGIYDESGEKHEGTIKKTGPGSGYVFLKKGAKVIGDVEVYSETNGDLYIYGEIGIKGRKITIRQVGPKTASGYIRIDNTCKIFGDVEIENSSNGGLIIGMDLPRGYKISKRGSGTGYLKLHSNCVVGNNVVFYNDSSGAILVDNNVHVSDNLQIKRAGSSDALLVIDDNAVVRESFDINMDGNGKVYLLSYIRNTNLVINCRGSKNKIFKIHCDKLYGNVTFINESNGTLESFGSMTDGSVLTLKGSGNGGLKSFAAVDGKPIIINDTGGEIYFGSIVNLNSNNIISKIGTGKAPFTVHHGSFKGRFILDSNIDGGLFVIEGGIDPCVDNYRYPIMYDGVYVVCRGVGFNKVRFAWGLEVLGKVNIDFGDNKYEAFQRGNYNNGYEGCVNKVLEDGYTWKCTW